MKEISYRISGKGKSWSYEYGKLYPGRYTFLPGQIFVFGGFALRANSLCHLEQIESYAPGRQVRFGSLNFTADIRGDLIYNGFDHSRACRTVTTSMI